MLNQLFGIHAYECKCAYPDMSSTLTLLNGKLAYMETLGKRLRKFRDDAGMKQGQMAAKAGLTRAAVSLIETDSTANPLAVNILKLAAVLGRSPYDLMFGEVEANKYPEHVRNAQPHPSACEPVASYTIHGEASAVPPELEPIISDMLFAWNTKTISPAVLRAWHQMIRAAAQMGDLPAPTEKRGPGITKNISKLLDLTENPDESSH